jgi:FkbM family methyltransferase
MQPVWTTPQGHTVRLEVREGTNDWDICQSIIAENEYRIPPLTGTALDVGAHIGAATVLMLTDNPELRVVAIEPLPANVELLRRNTAQFGDRVTIIEAAASFAAAASIHWNFRGSADAERHRFIGNQRFGEDVDYDEQVAAGITLSELVERFGPFSFMKIDAEGAEHEFLDDPAIADVALIHGEWHDGERVEIRFDPPRTETRPAKEKPPASGGAAKPVKRAKATRKRKASK